MTIVLTALEVPWAAAKRGGHLVIAVDETLSPRRRKIAVLSAMTDAEYDSYQAAQSPAEQQRQAQMWAGYATVPLAGAA